MHLIREEHKSQSMPYTLSEKKGTKAVTGAVPFQKVNFWPF